MLSTCLDRLNKEVVRQFQCQESVDLVCVVMVSAQMAVHNPLPDNDPPVAFWDFPVRPPLPVAMK